MADQKEGSSSPDGRWWWSGSQWLPARTHDGKMQWTGQAWVPCPRWPRMTPWMLVEDSVWAVLCGIWIPILSILAYHNASQSELVTAAAIGGAVALASTLLLGGHLAYRRRWLELGLAPVLGSVILLFWYVVLVLSGPDVDNQNDHVVAVGIVLLAIPAFLGLAVPLGIGALLGLAARSIRRRR